MISSSLFLRVRARWCVDRVFWVLRFGCALFAQSLRQLFVRIVPRQTSLGRSPRKNCKNDLDDQT